MLSLQLITGKTIGQYFPSSYGPKNSVAVTEHSDPTQAKGWEGPARLLVQVTDHHRGEVEAGTQSS